MSDTPAHTVPVNHNAVISMLAAIVTVLSFCIAVAPIPLTGWVCYPAAFVSGLVAVVTGVSSLAQISRSQEEGRSYALIGITVGTLSILGAACAVALGIALFPKAVASLHAGIQLAGAAWQRIVQFVGSLR